MPFRSRAQQGFLFANHPEIARRWAKETSKKAYKHMPEHVQPKSPALRKAASVFLEGFADELEKTGTLQGEMLGANGRRIAIGLAALLGGIAAAVPGALVGGLASGVQKLRGQDPHTRRNMLLGALGGGLVGSTHSGVRANRLIDDPAFEEEFARSQGAGGDPFDIKTERSDDRPLSEIASWMSGVASKAEAKKHYREEIRKAHPDLGGSSDDTRRLIADWKAIQRHPDFSKLAAHLRQVLHKQAGLLGRAQIGRVLEGGKGLLRSEKEGLAAELHVRPEKLEHLLAEAKARRDPTASTHGVARAVTHAVNPLALFARSRSTPSPEAVKLLREEKHHAGVRHVEKGLAVTGLLGAAAAAHRRAKQIGSFLAPDPASADDVSGAPTDGDQGTSDEVASSYAPLFHQIHGLTGT